MKLLREIICHADSGKLVYRNVEKLGKIANEGIPEKGASSRTLSYDLSSLPPTNEYMNNYLKYGFKISDETRGLCNHLPPSINTVLLKCIYYVEITIDHGLLSLSHKIPAIQIPILVYP